MRRAGVQPLDDYYAALRAALAALAPPDRPSPAHGGPHAGDGRPALRRAQLPGRPPRLQPRRGRRSRRTRRADVAALARRPGARRRRAPPGARRRRRPAVLRARRQRRRGRAPRGGPRGAGGRGQRARIGACWRTWRCSPSSPTSAATSSARRSPSRRSTATGAGIPSTAPWCSSASSTSCCTTPIRARGAPAVFGNRLSDAQVAGWRRRIEDQPHRYVAQEKVDLATTPLLSDGSPSWNRASSSSAPRWRAGPTAARCCRVGTRCIVAARRADRAADERRGQGRVGRRRRAPTAAGAHRPGPTSPRSTSGPRCRAERPRPSSGWGATPSGPRWRPGRRSPSSCGPSAAPSCSSWRTGRGRPPCWPACGRSR